jgi:hypothetical protein
LARYVSVNWNLRASPELGKNERLLMLSLRDNCKLIAPDRRRNSVGLAIGLVHWILLIFNATAATFTASLDRDTIALGEGATLSLTFDGGSPDTVPVPPGNPNLQVTGTGTSSEFRLSNGQSSSAVTHTFRLTPRQPGEYTIPALTADVGGQKLTSQALTLRVLKPSAPPPEAVNSGTELAFLKLVLPRKEVYVGETFTAQLQLYLSSRVHGMGQIQVTSFPADGFNVGKMIEGQKRQVQIGNGVYTVIPVEVALRPIKAGPLTLGPITFGMVVELPSNRQRDVFDPFGMFNHGEQRQISVATSSETLQSLMVPREGAPADFSGAIGRFTMAMSAGPTNVAAGDPITVKVQISGRGSLDALTLPDQPAWHDFKTYPPTTKVETTDQLGLQGTKTFEQIVTPQSAEIKALPPISFSFFDPEAKAYRTLAQPAILLVVRPGGLAAAPTVLASAQTGRDNSPPPAQDIVPNKQRIGALAQIAPPLAQRTWFLALQAVPLLAFISAVVIRRRAENLANNPRLRRQREVLGLVEHGLRELKKSAAENNSDQFFATLVRLLQEQLGERLDLPATAITEAVIEERLRPRGVPESILNPLQELFQLSNLVRYAPIKTSQELVALIPKVEALLKDLRSLKV